MQNPNPPGGRARARRGTRRVPLLALAALLALSIPAWTTRAQESGTVAGVAVNSWDGTPLAGVAVTARGTTLATQSGADGRFELKGVLPGDQTLRFSKPGFATAVVTEVRVLAGQTSTVNANLHPEFYELEEYEVTAEVFTEQTERILVERQKSLAIMDSLGSDFLSRVGAGNAAESISKVAGATVVDGKSAVVRGLNDRYLTVTLNGALIPSADPYRQSASLDLFPAQVIDRVVVAKTFTPDQPGTFTGGGIDIVTKSFPEKPFYSFSVGGAYNSQASLNDRFLSYRGGGLDWAGMDDGARALPAEVSAQAPLHAPPPGALPPALRGNVPTNNSNYAAQYTLDKVTRELGVADFAPRRENSSPNHSYTAATGGSIRGSQQLLGYFAGVSYKHDYQFCDRGVARRYQQGEDLKSVYHDTRALSVVNWSGMANLAYRPFENHEIGFTFFYNQNGTDDARIQDQGFEQTDPSATFRKFNLYYTERNLNTYQLKGSHSIPDLARLQFHWLLALTQTTQDEPDARFFNDYARGGGYTTGNPAPNPSDPTRYFRALDENNRNVKLDWTLPFAGRKDEEGALKFGLYGSYAERHFTDRAFYYPGGGSYGDDPNLFLGAATLGAAPTTNAAGNRVNFHWGRYVQVFDSFYPARRTVQAPYLMAELPVLGPLRLVGGARYETTELRVHSESYIQSSVTGQFVNDATTDQGDLLPAAGLIWTLRTNMSLRVNYSQTVARPSFRELAAYYAYDPIVDEFVEGNPLLKMSSIRNYDLRWEWFARPGEVYSASLFYKDLQNAIERGNQTTVGDVITYFNRQQATLYGVELEARKNLGFLGAPLAPFTLGGNLSLVQSEVQLTPEELAAKRGFFPDAPGSRPLYDQSPYVANVDLSYTHPRSGPSASLIFNLAGPRITLAKLNTQDVYEQPALALDFVLSQKIGRHSTLKFSIRNLLDPSFERTYGKNSGLLYSSQKKGWTLGLTWTYDF